MTEKCDRCGDEKPDDHCKPINEIQFNFTGKSDAFGKVSNEQYSEKLDNKGKYCKNCVKEVIKITKESFDIRKHL